jgi:hypothetical protein
MPHKWSEKNIGMLKFGRGEKKTLIAPGKEIPTELVTEKLLKRFEKEIVEFEKVREIPKSRSKRGDSK